MSFHEIINQVILNRKSILTITFSVVIFYTIIIYLTYPLTFRATVTVLPPETNRPIGLGALLGNDITDLMGGGVQGNSQLFMEILKSRTASEEVINNLNLIEIWDLESMHEAVKELQKKLNLELTKEGIIILHIDLETNYFQRFSDQKDSVKVLSANIANEFVNVLDKINRNKLSTKAKRARTYIEEQLLLTKDVLDSAELKLSLFQKENKSISLPEQVSVAIETAAKIKKEIMEIEIELGLLSSNLRENNTQIQLLKTKLAQLNNQYSKIEIGSNDYLLAFSKVPELGLQLTNLLRDVRIYNEVYLLLQQQYFKEKIQENKDLPTVEILDAAIPPVRHSSPRMLYNSFLVLVISFLLMTIYHLNKYKSFSKYLLKEKDSV